MSSASSHTVLAACTCGCDPASHRQRGAGQPAGGCLFHRTCRDFTPETLPNDTPCACGAPRGQHYADGGRLRGPRGCQDYHLTCTPLCGHTQLLLHNRRTPPDDTTARPRLAQPPAPRPQPTEVPKHLLEEPLPPEPEPVPIPAPPAVLLEQPPASTPPPTRLPREPRPQRRRPTAVNGELATATRTVIAAALNTYPAWYCHRCSQRRLDDGRCPSCNGRLTPVHVLIVPRETS